MQEISPLPEAGSEPPIAPAEPLASAWPSVMSSKWMVAIIASCLLHAAVAAAFLITPAGTFESIDAVQMEGAEKSGADVFGSALVGQAQGAVDVVVVPDPRPTKPQVKPEPPAEQPAREIVAQPSAPPPQAVEPPTVAPDMLTAPTPDEQSAAPKTETPAEPVAPAESTEAPPADIGQPPIPTARPSSTSGGGGAGEAVGTVYGEEREAMTSSTGKKSGSAGNAIESGYSGDVQKKLERANRRVSQSVQAKARNNARVSFVVMADGSIGDIQLAESSGSTELDQFALTLVRRQAPFPPIPSETGRSSWTFRAQIGPF